MAPSTTQAGPGEPVWVDSETYIGAMSGTSLDGIDAVRVQFDPSGQWRVTGHVHRPFDADLQAELLALNQRGGKDELHRAARAANAVSEAYARTIAALQRDAGESAAPVRAVGAHGQTVRHQPGASEAEPHGPGYTVQLINGALLAERCGLDVIVDFRSRDLAAGGQGAPLVPAFHARCFGMPGHRWAVLNLGGIGNLTLGSADGQVTGFDCGPGNALLDHWCVQHRQLPFDANGDWGASGLVRQSLLDALLAEPYLQLRPPKSTGRDLFHAEWLNARLGKVGAAAWPAADVQATLGEFTARAAADALRAFAGDSGQGAGEAATEPALPQQLLVCGGGALNADLMRRLGRMLPGVKVASTAQAGLPPMQVEAAAFAWLARAFVRREPGSLAAVTGAQGGRILGALYPA